MKHGSSSSFPSHYGKYQLLERIGHGGMAEVFRARLPGVAGFERIVVIKRLLPHLAENPAVVRMFVNEAKLAAEIQHRNIVPVFELGRAPSGEFYMAMEYVPGTDLAQVLRAAAVNALRIPPWFSVHLVTEILDGLAYAHELRDAEGRKRNIVHRDVTPANIFISQLGDIKLGDFGVAKESNGMEATRTGQLKGKVPYMSPEQLHGLELDGRTDVFAAGVVLWECLTQRRLFGGRPDIEAMNLICDGQRKPPSRVSSDVPPELDAVVLRAVSADVSKRTASARELRDELYAVLPRLRERVLPKDVRSIVESLLGSRDPTTSTGPLAVHDEEIVLKNFRDPTPAPWSGGARESLSSRVSPPVLLDEVVPDAQVQGELTCDLEPQMLEGEDLTALASDSCAAEDVLKPPAEEEDYNWIDQAVLSATEDLLAEDKERAEVEPRSTSLAGLDHRRHAVCVSSDALGERDYMVVDAGYEGPHPFWVYGHDRKVIGPLQLRDAITVLCYECRGGHAEVAISGDRETWLNALTFAALNGLEIVIDPWQHKERELPRSNFAGTFHHSSAIAVFGRIARERATGRLILLNQSHGFVRREIELVEGHPTFVYANDVDLQMPPMLVKKRAISQDQAEEMVRAALNSRRRIEDIVHERTGVNARLYRSEIMKERLVDVFRWRDCKYLLDSGGVVQHSDVFAPSIVTLLSEMVSRTKSTEELHSALQPYLDAQLQCSERWTNALDSLRLHRAELDLLNLVAKGKTLTQAMRSSPQDQRINLATIHVLVEVGLLLKV
jgi:serine/threonine-protein kinase